jgi:hypothetical protein
MIRDLVNYDTALELNGLGFNEPCFCIYNREKALRFNNLHNPHDRDKGVKLTSNSGRYPAPTLSQAFRFFREKHHYSDITTGCNQANEIIGFSWRIWRPWSLEEWSPENGINEWSYETYEEAELACLVRLIEIVKSGELDG